MPSPTPDRAYPFITSGLPCDPTPAGAATADSGQDQARLARRHLTIRLLAVLPAPEDEPVPTDWVIRQLDRHRTTPCRLLSPILKRFGNVGLLHRTRTGKHSRWTRAALLDRLFNALPAPEHAGASSSHLAQALRIDPDLIHPALVALVWSGLAASPNGLRLRRNDTQPRWRRRTNDPLTTVVGSRNTAPDRPARPATVVAVIGSPIPGSRTRATAEAAIHALARAGVLIPAGPAQFLELAEIVRLRPFTGSRRTEPAHRYLGTVLRSADLLIVATPTCLGTFSGLLKIWLDTLNPAALTGIVTIPAAIEPLARQPPVTGPDLSRVLAHLGAVIPAPALSIPGPDNPATFADSWAATHGPVVRHALAQPTDDRPDKDQR